MHANYPDDVPNPKYHWLRDLVCSNSVAVSKSKEVTPDIYLFFHKEEVPTIQAPRGQVSFGSAARPS